MLRRAAPYIPPALTAAILGTLFVNEFDKVAPERFKLKIRPLLGRKSAPPPEFSGDAAPQQGVFSGGDRNYSAVIVVQGTQQTEKKVLARSAARACMKWNDMDVDLSLGLGPKVWEAVKGNVPLGNFGQESTDFKLKDRTADKSHRNIANTGGDIIVHIKADTQARCFEVVKTVLKELENVPIAWSEDQYGFAPEKSTDSIICPSTKPSLTSTSTALCKIACVPKVGSSYMLYQRWEDDLSSMKGKAKPVSNHAERMKGMDQDGNKLEIVKHTAQTGKLGSRATEDKAGMLFVAYSADPRVFEYMLDRMVGRRGGTEDTTLVTSKCTRTQLFYVPSRVQVRALASP